VGGGHEEASIDRDGIRDSSRATFKIYKEAETSLLSHPAFSGRKKLKEKTEGARVRDPDFSNGKGKT